MLTMLSPFLASLLVVLLILSNTTPLVHGDGSLLNAYQTSIERLTAPHTFYFLEFPLDLTDESSSSSSSSSSTSSSSLSPMCGNGSPYSFLFRRGSDVHRSKLLVEFEGGPAYWERPDTDLARPSFLVQANSGSPPCSQQDEGCECKHRGETPWNEYLQSGDQETLVQQGVVVPPLDSCTGVAPGFLQAGLDILYGTTNALDVPMALRQDRNPEWFDLLDENDIRDWSYILLPHCTMDWHLGHQGFRQPVAGCQEDFHHRGGVNAQAVLDWVNTQFESEGGLEALITTSGGRMGGCGNDKDDATMTSVSSIAPMFFAAGAQMQQGRGTTPTQLVVSEGASVWNRNLPNQQDLQRNWGALNLLPPYQGTTLIEVVEYMVQNTNAVYAWFANDKDAQSNEEAQWLSRMQQELPQRFHPYSLSKPEGTTTTSTCPLFAFPEASPPSKELSNFLVDTARRMAWMADSDSSQRAVGRSNRHTLEDGTSRPRLSFLSIAIILMGVVLLSWLLYYYRLAYHDRKQEQLSPSALWSYCLTQYPRQFLLISLVIPISLSFAAFAKSGYQVKMNLNFDSYLDINTEMARVAESYAAAQRYQLESLIIEEENCAALLLSPSSIGNRWLAKEKEEGPPGWLNFKKAPFAIQMDQHATEPANLPFLMSSRRELQYELYQSGGQLISILYQNRNGGNVFEPDVLESIREFEQSILDFPGFSEYCFSLGTRCIPFDSIVPLFFPQGDLVNNIDGVLESFLEDPTAIWKVDQYFGPYNLASNITRTFVWLRDVGGDQSSANEFLEYMYRELLWKTDQARPHVYPNMTFTWFNGHMYNLEAADAVNHDALWACGSFIFIGLMILFKVRSIFVFVCSMLGLGLSFTTAYYFCLVHFGLPEITLLHVSSLFVMMGIGADDIFLMVDSFEHTKLTIAPGRQKTDAEEVLDDVGLADTIDGSSNGGPEQEPIGETPEITRQRMESAYATAGSMMLVSSVTTAICFFSNAFAVVIVIQEFGIYVGMVVVINFVHVMTILPSAILVNELYVLPWWRQVGSSSTNRRDDPPRLVEASEDKERAGSTEPCTLEGMGNGNGTGQPHHAPNKSSGMNRTDRWLVDKYAPFVTRRRFHIVTMVAIMTMLLGGLGILKFGVSDGTIILFTEDYNIGRWNLLNQEYFNADLSKTIEAGSSAASSGGSSSSSSSTDNAPINTSNPGSENTDSGNGIVEDGSSNLPSTPADVSTQTPGPISAPSPPSAIAVTNPTPGQTTNMPSGGTQPSIVASIPNPPMSTPISAPSTWAAAAPISGNLGPTAGQPTTAEQPIGTGGQGSPTAGTPTVDDLCLQGCRNGGICTFEGTCYCENGWRGDFCTVPVCPMNNGTICSGLGLCVAHSNGVVGSTKCQCDAKYSGIDCGRLKEEDESFIRREALVVKLLWGLVPADSRFHLWMTPNAGVETAKENDVSRYTSLFDLSEPNVQSWILNVVLRARNETRLHVQLQLPTWIEILEQFAIESGIGFPIPKDLFVGYLELLKRRSQSFADLISDEIGTRSPGLAGDFLYASVTLRADVVNSAEASSLSVTTFREWSNFVNSVNKMAPLDVPKCMAQSSTFLNAHRAEATISSTATSWLISNGLCLAIIFLFTQNVLLSLMVMVATTMIFLCLGGLLFGIFALPFGPVEALGVSIFIGLSANYSLHMVHAYHHSLRNVRADKVQDAIFVTGSPIAASALSTIGGCLFLFACRTWVFIELGILICCVTAMALLFSMSFLPSWLAMVGPLPVLSSSMDTETDQDGEKHPSHHRHRRHPHHCDLRTIWYSSSKKKKSMMMMMRGASDHHSQCHPVDTPSRPLDVVASDEEEGNVIINIVNGSCCCNSVSSESLYFDAVTAVNNDNNNNNDGGDEEEEQVLKIPNNDDDDENDDDNENDDNTTTPGSQRSLSTLASDEDDEEERTGNGSADTKNKSTTTPSSNRSYSRVLMDGSVESLNYYYYTESQNEDGNSSK